MNTSQEIRKARIKVNKQVVKHLSLGLYRNFALAIKELISNAYDAGATEVKLKLDLKDKRIILRDNGRGMSESEFKDEYLHIGFFKEPSNIEDELGRMRIGTFGIGFLAPLPYCRLLRIITKKSGKQVALEGEIKADNFFTKSNWDIKEEEVEYKIYKSDLPIDEGETIIILENIKEQIHEELTRETKVRRTVEGRGYEKFKWTLAQYCPIEYSSNQADLRNFFGVNNRVPMKLWLDGDQLYRNVPEGVSILENKSKTFGDIDLKYVIMTPFKTVKPEEMRGLQLRLKDVAIGFPRDFDVTKLGRVKGKLNMLCGEVHIQNGLDNALLVNRDSFNFTEDVSQVYEFFRDRLTYWNERLYKWAEGDKELYLALGELRENDAVLDDLAKLKLLHFSKERLRLSEGTLRKPRQTIVDNPVDRVVKALSKTGGETKNVVVRREKISSAEPAIRVDADSKTISVYKNHPVFVETIEFGDNQFKVEYEEWQYYETPYAICRLTNYGKTVVFNKSHPLFKSNLNDNVAKRLALGILIILNEVETKEILLARLNKLLEDTFSER